MEEWVTAVVAAGGLVVWVARLEFRVGSTEKTIALIQQSLQQLADQGSEGLQRLARIEGRLNGNHKK